MLRNNNEKKIIKYMNKYKNIMNRMCTQTILLIYFLKNKLVLFRLGIILGTIFIFANIPYYFLIEKFKRNIIKDLIKYNFLKYIEIWFL